jgi:DNA-directed RNA polymerase subunit M/transcription elongation factor TFIIS
MEFCDGCRNMLYLRTQEATADGTTQHALFKYCKACGLEKQHDGGAFRVSRTVYAEEDLLYLQHQNPYLRHDPTLPRVCDPKTPCPNAACTGPHDKPQVLYVKYHPVHMKYLYCCDYCGHFWRGE